MDDSITDRKVDRRKLLRRAGTVAAGVAGAGVASAVVATPAQAASGDFDSSSATEPALTVVNDFTADAGGYIEIGPQLQLSPGAGHVLTDQAPTGSVAMDQDGYIWVATGQSAGTADLNFLHTTQNSNLTIPLTPTRVFDSYNLRDRLVGGTIVSNHLKASSWAHISLGDFTSWAQAVFIGIQVLSPSSKGWIAVGPYVGEQPARPSWSNLNFGSGSYTTDQMTFTALGAKDEALLTDVISLYPSVEVRVIVDLYAVVADTLGRVNPVFLPGVGLQAAGETQYAKRLAQIARQPKV